MRMIDPKAKTNLLYVSQMAYDQMQRIPTIDAEVVVRCKDCEKRDKGFVSEKGTVSCPYMEAFMPADGFCSYGERKDGGYND